MTSGQNQNQNARTKKRRGRRQHLRILPGLSVRLQTTKHAQTTIKHAPMASVLVLVGLELGELRTGMTQAQVKDPHRANPLALRFFLWLRPAETACRRGCYNTHMHTCALNKNLRVTGNFGFGVSRFYPTLHVNYPPFKVFTPPDFVLPKILLYLG